MELEERLPRLVRRLGGDLYGVADLRPAKEEIMRQGGEMVADYPRAISVGVVLNHPIVDLLPLRERRAAAVQYRTHAYELVNQRLDGITSRVASELQNQGFKALPISASERSEDKRICAIFSHKLAAHLAGLGWIGKSCLLVTPEMGPRVRWATVLTNASLSATGTPMEQRCGSCHECVDICPQHAFTGRNFQENEPREARYDAKACNDHLRTLEAEGKLAVCGLCLYICPYGIRASKKL